MKKTIRDYRTFKREQYSHVSYEARQLFTHDMLWKIIAFMIIGYFGTFAYLKVTAVEQDLMHDILGRVLKRVTVGGIGVGVISYFVFYGTIPLIKIEMALRKLKLSKEELIELGYDLAYCGSNYESYMMRLNIFKCIYVRMTCNGSYLYIRRFGLSPYAIFVHLKDVESVEKRDNNIVEVVISGYKKSIVVPTRDERDQSQVCNVIKRAMRRFKKGDSVISELEEEVESTIRMTEHKKLAI